LDPVNDLDTYLFPLNIDRNLSF